MAIDLFCYSKLSVEQVSEVLDLLVVQHSGLFSYKTSEHQARFIIYGATKATDVQKEIALECGLDAKCEFMIHLNEKSAADLVQTVLYVVRTAFGADNVIIMSDGELC